jgi:hypothetical protein
MHAAWLISFHNKAGTSYDIYVPTEFFKIVENRDQIDRRRLIIYWAGIIGHWVLGNWVLGN